MFPSPYGDFVFQLILKNGKVFIALGFPSPYGDFVFQHARQHTTKILLVVIGFRPLTGILFFNAEKEGYYGTGGGIRFRPLTGILFFNLKKAGELMAIPLLEFPSPYGDFVFQRG